MICTYLIFGINPTCDISKLSYNNFEISLVVFMTKIALQLMLLPIHILYYTVKLKFEVVVHVILVRETIWLQPMLPNANHSPRLVLDAWRHILYRLYLQKLCLPFSA